MIAATKTSAHAAHRLRNTNAIVHDLAIASIPAALAGTWTLGREVLVARTAAEPEAAAAVEAAHWQLRLLEPMGLSAPAPLANTVLGLALLAPPLLVALAASLGWARLFARLRGRSLDPGWALSAWLFVLLLPAGTPLYLIVLGISFGAVFGAHVFGGTGKNLVNPALLGTVFLFVAYPSLLGAGAWVGGTGLLPAWQVVAAGGIENAGLSWIDAFVGRHVGAFGTSSAAACGLGAIWLLARRSASWHSFAGAAAGIVIAGWGATDVPWHWQPVLGSFAFATAFLLTDPSTSARTTLGTWSQGLLFGMLAVLIRMANPEHPEGTLFALLLATLCTPLLDNLAVRLTVVARRRRHAR